MSQRKVADYLRLIDGKAPPRRASKSPPADTTPPEQRGTEQPAPPAPGHFNAAEKRAWADVTGPLARRGLWHERYGIWAESFAALLAVSRGKERHNKDHKINRSQLRLYANDLRQILSTVLS